jgi:hypothetical protein
MGRKGVKEEEIIAAIEVLVANGIPINKNTVRDALGTGSFTTIIPVIKKWENSRSHDPEPANLTLPVPEVIQALFVKAWSAARAAAQAELVPQRDAMTLEAAGLKAVIEAAELENLKSLRTYEDKIELLEAKIEEGELREQVAQTRLTDLSEKVGYYMGKLEASAAESALRIKEKDAQIAALETALSAAVGHS